MSVIKRKLTHFIDPGHGWVSVSHQDLIRLGIVHEISSASYMNATRAYLEEDGDFNTFMEAARDYGWQIQFRESYYHKCFIRSLGSYKPYFVENPLKPGSLVTINRDQLATVVRISKTGYLLETRLGFRYRVPLSNPYLYVRPPMDAVEQAAI